MKLFRLGFVFALLLWSCEERGLEDSPGADCVADYDCSGSLVCIAGKCLEPGDTCRVDVDCDDNLICVGGLCVSNDEINGSGGRCSTDKECKGDRICVDGHCVYTITGDGCSVDTECKEGRVCINGQCHYPQAGNMDGGTAGNGSNAGNNGTAGSSGSVCGNGVVEVGEHCDGENLNGHTCASIGMGGGMLRCNAACLFDASLCESINAGYGDGSVRDGGNVDVTMDQCVRGLASYRTEWGISRTEDCEACLCSNCSEEIDVCSTFKDLCWARFNCGAANECTGDCCFCGNTCDTTTYYHGPCSYQMCMAALIPSVNCSVEDNLVGINILSQCNTMQPSNPCAIGNLLYACQTTNCPMCPSYTCP